MTRTALTDEQIWTLIQADASTLDRTLAAELRVNLSTVHNARWRFRRKGWTCAVRYVTCDHCGEPLIRRGRYDSTRKYHPGCAHQVKEQQAKEWERERWGNLSASEQQTVLDRGHRHTGRWQEATQGSATNKGRRWQVWEDETIMDPAAPPDYELATELGRTLHAVRGRRQVLRRLEQAVDR
jgi:hypothetical protein